MLWMSEMYSGLLMSASQKLYTIVVGLGLSDLECFPDDFGEVKTLNG